MENFTLSENISINKELDNFTDNNSKIKVLGVIVDGIQTDIVFCDYSDKQFLIITQFQKVGTLILVTKGNVKNLNEANDMYDIKTICGLDNQEYHLAARYLAQQLKIYKPIMFSICLKDHSLKTLKSISKILRDNYIFEI